MTPTTLPRTPAPARAAPDPAGPHPHPDADPAAGLHARADAFVAGLDRDGRRAWLQRRGVPDRRIRQALQDSGDPDLDAFTRDLAHGIADQVGHAGPPVPDWLAAP
ncbi:hypothetical protein [Granulicoccus phenolivorans]|uniref:hypothetical protein n=1 Tax=Granulicoccus phenolivorans TaxID=266854 RepID=UPI00040F882C|nr:hypothetical protein [Granulicoccus phenolivorans]